MNSYQVLSKQQHAKYQWKRAHNYAFAATDLLAPLVQQELPKAALHLPVAFVEHAGSFVLVALLGLQQGTNLLVVPANGQWIGGYVPAALRGYPFALVPADDGRKALAVDMASGLVGETVEGEALFANEQPTEALQALLNFLTQLDKDRAATAQLCALLAAHGLIQPWPIKAMTANGEKQIKGLLRIDAAKLNQLDAQALHALQQAGALQMAYCQLMSTEHLAMLGNLAQLHAQYQTAQAQQAAQPKQPLPLDRNGELDLEFLNQGGTLNLSHL